MSEKPQPMSKRRRNLYISTPLLFLIACLAFINLLPMIFMEAGPDSQIVNSAESDINNLESEIVRETNTVEPSPAEIPLLNSTVTTQPSPTIMPLTTLPPDSAITLLGPPSGSTFQKEDTVSLYWHWPLPLQETQRLALLTRIGEKETVLTVLDEPNLGRNYRSQIEIETILNTDEDPSTTIIWFVRLFTSDTNTPLLESETRFFLVNP